MHFRLNMRNHALIFVLVSIFSCQKRDFNIVNLNGNKITTIGHGGMSKGHAYPINSFESILNCLSLGADGAELDIQLTRDGQLVLFHDDYLEHSTHNSGQIASKTWDEIKNTSYKHPVYGNYKLINLDQLLANIPNLKNYTFFLDCKHRNVNESGGYVDTYSNALIRIIDKYNLVNNVILEFKSSDLISAVQNQRKDIRIFAKGNYDYVLQKAIDEKLQGISISLENTSKDEVQKAHNNAIMVALTYVESKSENIEAIEKNADFIQSDKIRHLVKVLK